MFICYKISTISAQVQASRLNLIVLTNMVMDRRKKYKVQARRLNLQEEIPFLVKQVTNPL